MVSLFKLCPQNIFCQLFFVFKCQNNIVFLQFTTKNKKQMSKGDNYKLSQMFGYKGPNEKVHQEDIISVMKFDPSGEYLVLGDKAGRIIIFEANHQDKTKKQSYDYHAEFQSHSKQFDFLNSQQVQETITDICWLNSQSKYKKLLTTNSKAIKLWKIYEKTQKRIAKSCGSNFKMPVLQTVDNSFIASPQITFPSKHLGDIHTISKSVNQEYLLSFDNVQGYMWNLQRTDKPYIAVDYLRGMEVQDVKQNITCGKYHPVSDSILAYGTNKKTLKIHDMRTSPRQSASGVLFKYDQKDTKNFFTDLISNYTSVQFLKDGKYIAARDFLTVKVWDVCNNKRPILNVPLQQNYKQKLCEMFQNDCIFDKFKIGASKDGNTILTGNYNNNFHLLDLCDGTNTQFDINYNKSTVARNIPLGKSPSITKMDYQRKTNALDFNQKKNVIAVASLNCFFVYSI